MAEKPRRRAPRTEGPRTTLRLPKALASSADRLADELGISRNDALLRLARRGAQLYEREHEIEVCREKRWAAIVPGEVDLEQLPPPDEARAVILASRGMS